MPVHRSTRLFAYLLASEAADNVPSAHQLEDFLFWLAARMVLSRGNASLADIFPLVWPILSRWGSHLGTTLSKRTDLVTTPTMNARLSAILTQLKSRGYKSILDTPKK